MAITNSEGDLRRFVKDVDAYVNYKFLPVVKEKFKYLEQRCYVQAKNDENKFAECMETVTQKLLEEERTISYKNLFLQQYLYECFTKSQGNLETINKCRISTKEMIDKSYESFFKNIN